MKSLNIRRFAEAILILVVAYGYAKQNGILEDTKKLTQNIRSKTANTAIKLANKLNPEDTNIN